MIPINKKITVLHPYLNNRGGAVNMMIYLSNFLSDKNNVDLYTFSYNKNYFPNVENNFTIKYFNNSKIISIIKIAYNIRKSDYIFIGNSPMHFVGVISKILFKSKAKIIWWNHHYPWYYNGKTNVYIKIKKNIEKYIIKSIDVVIVNSLYLQKAIKEIYKIDSKILYPVLDDKFLNHISNKKLFIGNTIFTYGRWSEGKNLKLIFDTYDNLKEKIPNLIIKIGGEGIEIEKFKNKYKNEDNVKFLGVINKNEIISNLEKSNLFLFPSKIDSFGLVTLESMSIGLPVISYNINGAKEIIKNGINGYLVDSDSEFIDKCYSILINSSLQNKLYLGSIKTSKTFSHKTFNNQLSKIF